MLLQWPCGATANGVAPGPCSLLAIGVGGDVPAAGGVCSKSFRVRGSLKSRGVPPAKDQPAVSGLAQPVPRARVQGPHREAAQAQTWLSGEASRRSVDQEVKLADQGSRYQQARSLHRHKASERCLAHAFRKSHSTRNGTLACECSLTQCRRASGACCVPDCRRTCERGLIARMEVCIEPRRLTA